MSCDAEDWGFQMLNYDEIVTSVQEESDNDNDETDEDEDNNDESSKGLSNSDAISVLETAMEWYENRERSYSTTVAQENQRPCSEKTEVCNVTAKNKRLFSTIKVKLRPVAFSSSMFSAHVLIFNICIVSGFIYCMDLFRLSER
ncbi:UNVERIFIED_CONTAM: hypothetical protein NCL1_04697 [Trichonephila clavipes]